MEAVEKSQEVDQKIMLLLKAKISTKDVWNTSAVTSSISCTRPPHLNSM